MEYAAALAHSHISSFPFHCQHNRRKILNHYGRSRPPTEIAYDMIHANPSHTERKRLSSECWWNRWEFSHIFFFFGGDEWIAEVKTIRMSSWAQCPDPGGLHFINQHRFFFTIKSNAVSAPPSENTALMFYDSIRWEFIVAKKTYFQLKINFVYML